MALRARSRRSRREQAASGNIATQPIDNVAALVALIAASAVERKAGIRPDGDLSGVTN